MLGGKKEKTIFIEACKIFLPRILNMISPALPDSVEYRGVAQDDRHTGKQEPENEQELLWGGPILPETCLLEVVRT